MTARVHNIKTKAKRYHPRGLATFRLSDTAEILALEMMDQHRRSPLSQATVQCSPESSWDLVLIGGQVFSAQPWGLVPDAYISGNNWNNSQFLSTSQQYANGFYAPTIGQVSLLFTWIYRRFLNISVPT